MVFSELIALYLFLGGTSAGAFAVMSVMDLRVARNAGARCGSANARRIRVSNSEFVKRLARTVYAVSFAMLIAGLLCLLADLGKPQAFYLLFLYPTSSFMSIGSFALALLSLCMAISTACVVLELGSGWKRASYVAKLAGIVLSVVVMLYTGMLLKTVISISVWQSWWLPVLFLFSALSCGCGLIAIAAAFSSEGRGSASAMNRFAALDAVFIVLEACAAFAYACSLAFANAQSLEGLLCGDRAWVFWIGFVACGIVIPLAANLGSSLLRRERSASFVAAIAAFVLVGGLALRFALVSAGIQLSV